MRGPVERRDRGGLVYSVRARAWVGAALLGAAAGAPQAQQGALEEIVVTATKRGELSVQDIAGGIKAVSGDTIDTYDFRSLDDFSRLEPSLTFATQGTGDSQLVIRGIQSPGSSTVGFYFDETVITASNFQDGGGRTPDIRLYDIDRVEVLKGPQGTLFGASSMSGTVRIITNKPDATGFDADVSVTGMGTDKGEGSYKVNGMVNVPLIDNTLAMRAVAWQEELGGFIDNAAGAGAGNLIHDANDANVSGGRIMARWTPNDRLTVDAYGLVQEVEVDGVQSFYQEPSGVLAPIAFAFAPGVFFGPFPGQYGDLNVTKPAQEPWDDTIYMFGSTAEYELDFGTLLATANYFDRDVYSPFDTTPTSQSFGLPFPAVLGTQNQDRSILSTELRFSSDFDGPINFVAGFFYEEDDNFNDLGIITADAATGAVPCTSRGDCLEAGEGGRLIFARTLDNEIDFFRIFGHVDWELTDKWSVGGGVAYFDGELTNLEFTTQALPPTALPPALGGPPRQAPIPGVDEQTDTDEVTFDASLSYQHTPTQMYYFRAASGFRPGGINDTSLGAQFGIDIPPTFEPDTVLSLEVGAKTSWFDDRLTLNAAYFKMFWDDIHVPGEEPTGAFEFIANAAEADIDGVEVELFARPTDQWYLTFGLTWLDAELSDDQNFPPGFPVLAGQPRGFDGDPIPKVPEWAFSGSAEYTLPFAVLAGVETRLRASYSYKDESLTFFNQTDQFVQEIGDYFLLDLNASFIYENWELRLFATNVTDEVAIVDADSGVDGFDMFTVRPRSVGAQLRWQFQ